MTSTIDLHMHSSASDGTDSPLELMEKAAAAGISVFAITDHDTVEGAVSLMGKAPAGITFLPGVEFSCRAGAGGCHILAYGCRLDAPALVSLLAEAARLRRRKLAVRLEFLRDRGAVLTEEETAALQAMPSAGKPHLGALLVAHGIAPDITTAIREVIDLCPTPSSRLDARTVIQAVDASGGISVWAHPFGEEGKRALTEAELRALMGELTSCGIRGMECWYSKYPAERCQSLAAAARANGLLVSGGSDYHGRNKGIPMGKLSAGGEPPRPEELTVLAALGGPVSS